MDDLIEQVRASVPAPTPLDLDAVRRRAAAIRHAEDARRRRFFLAIAAGVVTLLAVTVPLALRGEEPGRVAAEATPAPTQPGEEPAGFEQVRGPAVDGSGEASLALLVDGPTLVVVWAPWCGPCVDMLDEVVAHASEPDAVPVVIVAVRSDVERVRGVLDAVAPGVPALVARDHLAVGALLGSDAGLSAVEALPTTLVVNDAGAVVDVVRGAVNRTVLRRLGDTARTATDPAVVATEAGPTVATPEPSSSACPVTRRVPTAQTYVVQRHGQPLSEIAEDVYGVADDAPHLAEANGVPVDVVLCEGQELSIPAAPGTAPAPTGDRTYVVQPGDSLADIARAVYGFSELFGLIAEANGIDESNPLQVGHELVIPPVPAGYTASEPPEPLPSGPFDAAVAEALRATAPDGWANTQASATERGWAGPGAQVRFTTPPAPGGDTWAAVQALLDAGGAPVELADGAVGALAGSPWAGWQLLVPLPGERLLQADAPDGTDGFSDHDASSVLFGWATDVRAALGQ